MGDTLSANPGIMDSASSFNSTLDRCEFWSSRERIREISYPNLPKKGALPPAGIRFFTKSRNQDTKLNEFIEYSHSALPFNILSA
jgi:hypothetical protein